MNLKVSTLMTEENGNNRLFADFQSSPTELWAWSLLQYEICYSRLLPSIFPLCSTAALSLLRKKQGSGFSGIISSARSSPHPRSSIWKPTYRGRLPAKRNCGMTYRTRQTAKMRRQEAEPMAHLHMLRNLFFSRADNVSRRFSEVGQWDEWRKWAKQ